MPYGYLTNGIVFAILTLCALAPARRPWLLAEITFVLGLAVNELPQFVGYIVLAATAAFAAQGGLTSPGAWVAFGLNVLVLVGLAPIVVRGLRARTVLERALSTVGIPSIRRRRRWLRILLWPWRTRPAAVRRAANLHYAKDRGALLDVYHRRSRPAGAPVLIHLHGGAFRSGRKSTQAMPLLYQLAARGWVCISANYRLHPAQWPAPLVDAKAVVSWAHRHAHEYGGDSAAVFIAGSSAGGHLAADVALTQGDPPEDESSVVGAIVLGGYFGHTAGAHSSPYDFVRPDAPPFLVVHGTNDNQVPVAQASGFVSALRRAGAPAIVYAELPGTQHGFDLFESVRFASVMDAVISFTAWVREQSNSPTVG
ncbi:MAG TPA: alpha/beta hydrolase [Micromonosporaceae bacterium]|jgi:acetyl esterase/lipase